MNDFKGSSVVIYLVILKLLTSKNCNCLFTKLKVKYSFLIQSNVFIGFFKDTVLRCATTLKLNFFRNSNKINFHYTNLKIVN